MWPADWWTRMQFGGIKGGDDNSPWHPTVDSLINLLPVVTWNVVPHWIGTAVDYFRNRRNLKSVGSVPLPSLGNFKWKKWVVQSMGLGRHIGKISLREAWIICRAESVCSQTQIVELLYFAGAPTSLWTSGIGHNWELIENKILELYSRVLEIETLGWVTIFSEVIHMTVLVTFLLLA